MSETTATAAKRQPEPEPEPEPEPHDRPDRIRFDVRVRYRECDPMNLVHHSVYLVWFEMARVELLRASGVSYKQLEADGMFFVVARLDVSYKKPAYYDDVLTIETVLRPTAGVKLEHDYRVLRGEQLLVTATTTLVMVDRDGVLQKIPERFHV